MNSLWPVSVIFVDTKVACDLFLHWNHRLRVGSYRWACTHYMGDSLLLLWAHSTCCCSLVFSFVVVGRSCCRRLVFTLYTMSGMFLHFCSNLHTSVAISLSSLCAVVNAPSHFCSVVSFMKMLVFASLRKSEMGFGLACWTSMVFWSSLVSTVFVSSNLMVIPISLA